MFPLYRRTFLSATSRVRDSMLMISLG